MSLPSTSTLDREQPEMRPRLAISSMLVAVLVVLPIALAIVGAVVRGTAGTELLNIAMASAESLPFMLLAVLSYLGLHSAWGKASALIWLALLVGVSALGIVLIGIATVLTLNGWQPGTRPDFGSNGVRMIVLLVVGAIVSVGVGALNFVPAIRRSLSRFMPLDPDSFVHMIMLVAVAALMLLCFLTLPILGEPLLLILYKNASQSGADLLTRDDAGQLRDTLYPLIWIIPAAVLAVGYGITRDLGGALRRLGLVRPSVRQVLLGLGVALAMVVAVGVLSRGIDWVWGAMGWPKTDNEAFGELLGYAISPLGALVVGVSAGLSEELAIRGVLQPRAGILLSNLFFTSLHALQYNWDSLLIVFVVGLALGFLRKRTNTTTSAIAHGTYDFLLILASALAVPWFGQ